MSEAGWLASSQVYMESSLNHVIWRVANWRVPAWMSFTNFTCTQCTQLCTSLDHMCMSHCMPVGKSIPPKQNSVRRLSVHTSQPYCRAQHNMGQLSVSILSACLDKSEFYLPHLQAGSSGGCIL